MRFLIPVSYLGLHLVLSNSTLHDSPAHLPARAPWLQEAAVDTGKTLTADAFGTNSPGAWMNPIGDSVMTAAAAEVHALPPHQPSPAYRTQIGTSTPSGVFILRQKFPVKTASMEVTNVFGKTILTGIWRANTERLDLSEQPKGIYFLKLAWKDKLQEVLRVKVE